MIEGMIDQWKRGMREMSSLTNWRVRLRMRNTRRRTRQGLRLNNGVLISFVGKFNESI